MVLCRAGHSRSNPPPSPMKNAQKRIYTTDIYEPHFLYFLKTFGYIRKKCPYISEKHRPPPGKKPRIYTGPTPPRIPINARGGCAARTPLVSKPKKRFAKGKKVKKLKIKASWRGGNRCRRRDCRGSCRSGWQRGNSAGGRSTTRRV